MLRGVVSSVLALPERVSAEAAPSDGGAPPIVGLLEQCVAALTDDGGPSRQPLELRQQRKGTTKRTMVVKARRRRRRRTWRWYL